MSKRRLLRLVLECVVALVMVMTSLVGTGTIQVSPHHPSQTASPALTQPVSHAQLAPVASSPVSPAGTWYASHQPVYGPQAMVSTTPTFPQGRKPGEQPDLRTANSETYLNADGTWTRKTYGAPIHYQDAQGHWQTIDNTLIADSSDAGYAYGNKANGWHVHFASQAGGPTLVHAQFSQTPVAETLEGAAAVQATLSGSTVIYPNVFPGVDLRYGVGAVTLEETLLLHNAQGPASYTFTYHLPGATATQDAAGNIIFADAKGTVLLVIGSLLMYEADAQGQMRPQAAVSAQIQVTLSSKGPDFQITYTPDHTWLSDPKRHFPVAIDPTWQGGDAGQSTTNGNIYADTYVQSGNPTTDFWNVNTLRVGNCTASGLGTGTNRSFLKFPVNPPPAQVRVTSATLQLYQSSMFTGGTGATMNVYAPTTPWDATNLTWNNQVTGYWIGTGQTATTQNTWISIDVTGAAFYWWEGLLPLDGLELQYANENLACQLFASDNNSNSSLYPALTINYVQDTTAPGGSVAFNGGVGSTNQTTVTVTPQGTDSGALNEWSSNWNTVNGVYTSNLPPNSDRPPAYSVDSTHSQLIADTSSCGSSQCWTETTFTHSMNVNNWPTYTSTFKTDNVNNLWFGLTSNDNSETRAELFSYGGQQDLTLSTSPPAWAATALTLSDSSRSVPIPGTTGRWSSPPPRRPASLSGRWVARAPRHPHRSFLGWR